MKFRPLGDRVVVRRIKEDTKTAGGIIIPETAQEKPQEGEIISVGQARLMKSGKRTPLEVRRPATSCCSANGPAPKSEDRRRGAPPSMKESDVWA